MISKGTCMIDNQMTKFSMIIYSSIIKIFENPPSCKQSILSFYRTHQAIESSSTVL